MPQLRWVARPSDERLRLRPDGSLRFVEPRHEASTGCWLQNASEDVAVGWEALEHWGDDAARIERLAGGVANDVWSVRVDGRLRVGRLGARSDADLAWETDLLQFLGREGLTVPAPIPTTDGR